MPAPKNNILNRRVLLGACAWAALPSPAWAVVRPPAPAARRLKLFNAHTSETFDGPYRNADGPIPAAVADLSEFLRDHHSGAIIAMDMAAIDFLWDVLNAVGATAATILSAYRTPETNEMLARTNFGVAEHSQHIYGRALDFTIGSGLTDAMQAARKMVRGGVGWYPQSHFIHVDSGPVRNWTLGDGDLQRLLTDPAALREARLRRLRGNHGADVADAVPAPPRSQYGIGATRDDLVRPSQFTSAGSKEGLVRPSPYGGGS